MSELLIAGAGAIGQWLGARLQTSGHDVTLLARPRFVEPLRRLSVSGQTTMTADLRAVTTLDHAGRFDGIFVTAKAHQSAAIAPDLPHCLAPDGVVVTLQNGFGNGHTAAGSVGAERVAVALTSHGITIPTPGRVEHRGLGVTRIGPYVADAQTSADVGATWLRDAGLEPERVVDPMPYVWQKAIVNHAINPLAAARGVPNGALLDDPRTPDWATLTDETWNVSRAAGVRLPDPDAAALRATVRGVLERTHSNRCSMLQDIDAKRPTEIEHLSGVFVRLARRLGIPFVAGEGAYRALIATETAYLGEAAVLARTRRAAETEGRLPTA